MQNIGQETESNSTTGSSASRTRPSVFRSLTRLVIGGALLGVDELLNNLERWEALASQSNPPHQTEIEESLPSVVVTIPAEDETDAQQIRYALIGLAFETQARLQSGLRTINKVSSVVSNLTAPIVKPIHNSRIMAPLRQHYNGLVLRGQQEVDRWVEQGRTEDAHSRALAQTALYGTVDSSVNYLATNEELQELVQSQGVSLAGEVVEEVRERAVSADNFLEGIVRTMLRRPSRLELPEPPPEIMEEATPFRQLRGRIIRK